MIATGGTSRSITVAVAGKRVAFANADLAITTVRRLYEPVRQAEKAYKRTLAQRVALGRALLDVKEQLREDVGHGSFGDWLKRARIHAKTAQRAMRVALAIATDEGTVDWPKVAAAVERHGVGRLVGLPLDELAARATLHAVEEAIGLRDQRQKTTDRSFCESPAFAGEGEAELAESPASAGETQGDGNGIREADGRATGASFQSSSADGRSGRSVCGGPGRGHGDCQAHSQFDTVQPGAGAESERAGRGDVPGQRGDRSQRVIGSPALDSAESAGADGDRTRWFSGRTPPEAHRLITQRAAAEAPGSSPGPRIVSTQLELPYAAAERLRGEVERVLALLRSGAIAGERASAVLGAACEVITREIGGG